MALQLSSVSSQRCCIHLCCPLYLTHTPNSPPVLSVINSSHSVATTVVQTHPVFPDLLHWPLVLSLSFCIAPLPSLLYTRGHSDCLKTLLSVLLCSECPCDFNVSVRAKSSPYSGLETWDNLIFDFCRLWVLLPLCYLTLLAFVSCVALKCQVLSDLRAHGVSIPATLFPKVPT